MWIIFTCAIRCIITGVNSGVMLMNLTRLRKSSWLPSMIEYYNIYGNRITWGDQDLINIYFHFHPGKCSVETGVAGVFSASLPHYASHSVYWRCCYIFVVNTHLILCLFVCCLFLKLFYYYHCTAIVNLDVGKGFGLVAVRLFGVERTTTRLL